MTGSPNMVALVDTLRALVPGNRHEEYFWVNLGGVRKADLSPTINGTVGGRDAAIAESIKELASGEADAFGRMALLASPEIRRLAFAANETHTLTLFADLSVGSVYSAYKVSVPTGISSLWVETPTLGNAGIASHWVEINVAENAQLELAIRTPASQAHQFLRLRIRLGKNAQVHALHLDEGSPLARLALDVQFQGEDSHFAIRGASPIKKNDQSSRHIVISHNTPKCNSVQYFRSCSRTTLLRVLMAPLK